MEIYFTPDQVADRLQVSRDTVLSLFHSGKLEATAVGNGTKRRRFRVSQSQLCWYMAKTYKSEEFAKGLPQEERPSLKISRHMKRLEKARA